MPDDHYATIRDGLMCLQLGEFRDRTLAALDELKAEQAQRSRDLDRLREVATTADVVIRRYGQKARNPQIARTRLWLADQLRAAIAAPEPAAPAPAGEARDGERLVTVCDKCLRSCCWQGQFKCDENKGAGTVERTVQHLTELSRESPDWWKPNA